MRKKSVIRRSKKGITLRDVVVHVDHMGQRLSSQMTGMEKRMGGMEKRMGGMERKIDVNTIAIADLKKTLTERIDALDEDLTATMQDTLRIRAHVGMPVPIE